jgi:acetyltransferase
VPFLQSKPPGRFSLSCLFRPESVAVIGADSPAGGQVLRNILASGYTGTVLALAENDDGMGAARVYPDIASLPAAPELAVFAGEPDRVAGDAAALAGKGCFAGIVVTMGGDLAGVARATGMRLLGPGSFGVAVPEIGLNATRSHLTPPKGRLALVSQSAALCRAVLDWAEPNGVGFSHIVGVGGNADIGFGMVLDWLSRDPGTGPILLDIRRIKNSRAFLSAARAASRLRPVVAIRAGGRLMDPSGDADRALEGALRRAGVLSVSRFEDLLAAAETLSRAKPLRHEALAIVTNATGPGQLAADAALRDGLGLARLTPATIEAVRSRLPRSVPVTEHGPIYVGFDGPGRLAEVAAVLGDAAEVGGVLVVHAPAGESDSANVQSLASGAGGIRVPVLVCAMGETTGAGHRRALAAAGVPAFDTPEHAVRGFHHLVEARRSRAAASELPSGAVLTLTPDRAAVRRLFAGLRRQGRLALAQEEGLVALAAYGIPTVPTRVAASAEEAMDAAVSLGFPAVVKRRRTKPPAGDELGGLALDLRAAEEVRVAARAVLVRQTRAASDGEGVGLVVQRQVEHGRELRVRVADDPVFGPVIGFGQGGVAADLLDDIAVGLPPLNLPLARALIARTRAAATLGAFRDRSAANIEAIAETLVRVSQLVVDFPGIAALVLNPLIADAEGVMAVDAWISLRAAGAAPGRLAITPYPAEMIEQWDARGEAVVIRPIRPEDAAAHEALFHRQSPEDVRFRFFSAMRTLSPEQVARLTQIDYDREMALIAVQQSTGDTVAVARLVCEQDCRSAEFAIAVQPDMKGRGLASRLMRRLIEWGRARGVAEIVGQVLADNAPMLAFARHLGFEIHRLPGEDDVLEARMSLGEAG